MEIEGTTKAARPRGRIVVLRLACIVQRDLVHERDVLSTMQASPWFLWNNWQKSSAAALVTP